MKGQIFVALLCFGIFLNLLAYALIAPLLPGELIRRKSDLVYAGIIIGCDSALSMFLPPCNNHYTYPRFGYMPTFAAGIILVGCCIILTGASYYIPDNTVFIILNMAIRLIQGVGLNLIFQTSYTVGSIYFKHRFARILPFLSFASTCGNALGPPLSGVLYKFFGYPGPFFILGGVSLLYGILVVPQFVAGYESILQNEEVSEQKSQVTYKAFLTKRPIVSMIGVLIAFFANIFYEPILAGKLQLQFGFTSDQAAYFYAIYTVSNFLTNLVLVIFPIQKRLVVWCTVASIFATFAALLMGPSQHLGLPNDFILMGIGSGLMGMSAQLLLIPVSILVLKPLYEQYPQEIHAISRLFGAFRQFSLGLVFTVTPFYSSGMTSIFNYETTCESVALLFLIYLPFFLTIHLSHRDIRDNEQKSQLLLKDKF